MPNTVDIETIKKVLPHRYPFLLVDKILDYEKGGSIRTIKNVTVNEPFFQGHFSQKLVMPGVLIIEAMAQTAELMAYFCLGMRQSGDGLYYLAGVDKVRFRKMVVPGDQLLLEAEFVVSKRNICKFKTSARTAGKQVASAELLTSYNPVVT